MRFRIGFITIAIALALGMVVYFALPSQSIQEKINNAAAGDAIHIEGSYNERLNITKSSIKVVCDIKPCTIQGATLTGDNILLQDFSVLDSTNAEGGIVIKGNGNVVRNNNIERASLVGIQIQGNNNLVENNEVLSTKSRGTGDADGIRFFGDGNIIRGNYIHDLDYDDASKSEDAHIDCFQTWNDITKGVATNTIIEGNLCVNMQWFTPALKGQGFMVDGANAASNITIRNNVIRAYQSYILNVSGLKIENNVFDIYINGAGLNLSNNPNSVLKNNIFFASSNVTPIGVSVLNTGEPLTGGWNWYYRVDEQYTRTDVVTFPTDKQGINPVFVDPLSDFHLQIGSPACTAGENRGYVGAFPCDSVTATATP